ncbi:O-antigen ligase family protein [Anaerorudis cellulosivorans]|uniref:O-antigen ligase family protein n=1 Tax=Anaerorudis cellulosivorans TaxID=3397862 RepID=UPI00221F848D|nr:O-antigen ligase family protein [Seramator thermalis]MCW1735273.1 O-antigen ligase family protein [Seramator thermalis]
MSNKTNNNILNVILFICVSILTLRVITFIDISATLYYVALSILFFIVISYVLIYGTRVDKNTLLFLIIAFISILLNVIPSKFSPYARYLAFLMMIITFGPLFKSKPLYDFNKRIIYIFIFLFFLIVLLSIPLLGSQVYFAGITEQSMVLAPISAICIIYLVSNKQQFWKNSKIIKKIIYLLLVFASLVIIIATASRSAIIGCLISILFYFLVTSKNLSKLIKSFVVFIIIIGLSYPIWRNQMDGILLKFEIQDNMGGNNSRTAMWNSRITEFKYSPIIGIGFSNVLKESAGYRSEIDSIELGSSWLGLLSQMGVVGFISFFMLFFSIFLNLWKIKTNDSTKYFLLSLLIFFGVHMIFEGYILAAGSILSIFFWLILGFSNNYIFINKKNGNSKNI